MPCVGGGHVPNAERLLAKAGVARRNGEGYLPPLERERSGTERAKRSGGLHKRSAEDWGDPLRRATGAAPLSEVWQPIVREARAVSGWALRAGKAR